MRLRFYKMQGCGNDFLFLDYLNSDPPRFYANEIAFFCDRQFGIGADGLVILVPPENPKANVAWKFFNADGSEANMCGNAARCVVRFMLDRYLPNHEIIAIETKAGIIKGRKLEDGRFEVALFHRPERATQVVETILKAENHMFTAFVVDTGVPHAVLEVKDIHAYPINRVGKLLMKHEALGEAGANITFFQRLVGQRIRSTTFERGVEKETFACGTGATAAAIVYSEQYLQPFPVDVRVPGGDLTIDISPVSRMVVLQGLAEYTMTVEIEEIPQGFEKPHLYGERRIHT